MSSPFTRATRALLLTDVVDSTRLTETLGDSGVAALWAAHDRVARDLLRGHRGLEIDKTDGFLLLFEGAADAVAYAVAYHRALEALEPPLQARAGLHVGPVVLTHNRPDDVARGAKLIEVDGIAKPTAARVMSVAIGRQTLLTRAALDALGATPWKTISHGHWRMKGVAEPLELYEIGDHTAPFTSPPDGAKVYRVVRQGTHWLPVREVPHQLPAERDGFVGREQGLGMLASALADGARLVTVVGAGGAGKTRLVLHYSWSHLGDWSGGIWFADLSDALTPTGVTQAVARSLGVALLEGDPVAQLCRAIAGRQRCLVVLDNFEQVVAHADGTLGVWLDGCPDAAFVVTSREVLGLAGEHTLALPPLDAHEATELFEKRAAQARRGYRIPEAERGAVSKLVALLDCLPLAVELAAARIRVMPPRKLLERMSDRFRLLAAGGGRADRQATLRATIEWSWQLLDEAEQQTLAQLSVFEGGFTLEAAEAVVELVQLPAAPWTVDLVQSLVDKSLVRRVDEERFDLLVSIKVFAREALYGSSHAMAAERRHGSHYAWFGTEEGQEAAHRAGGAALRALRERELDNLLVGCERALGRDEAETALHCALAAADVLDRVGPLGAARAVLESVLPVLAEPDRSRSRLECALGDVLGSLGESSAALDRLEEATRIARALGDTSLVRHCQQRIAEHHLRVGHPEAARTVLQVLVAESRDDRATRWLLGAIGQAESELGNYAAADDHIERAMAMARADGDKVHMRTLMSNLAVSYQARGRLEEARALTRRTLEFSEGLGDRNAFAVDLLNLGATSWLLGEPGPAIDFTRRALSACREVGCRKPELLALSNLGYMLGQTGGPDQAQTALEECVRLAHESGHTRTEAGALSSLGCLLWQQGDQEGGSAHYARAAHLGEALGDRELVARTHAGWALTVASESSEVACAALADAEALQAELGLGPQGQLADLIARARAAIAASGGVVE